MKPDWKDAPEWAQWLAMDRDGKWTWFEDEPIAGDWDIWCNPTRGMWDDAEIRPIYEWRETLESRPEES